MDILMLFIICALGFGFIIMPIMAGNRRENNTEEDTRNSLGRDLFVLYCLFDLFK